MTNAHSLRKNQREWMMRHHTGTQVDCIKWKNKTKTITFIFPFAVCKCTHSHWWCAAAAIATTARNANSNTISTKNRCQCLIPINLDLCVTINEIQRWPLLASNWCTQIQFICVIVVTATAGAAAFRVFSKCNSNSFGLALEWDSTFNNLIRLIPHYMHASKYVCLFMWRYIHIRLLSSGRSIISNKCICMNL